MVVVRTEPVTLTAELSGRTSAFLVSEVRPQVSGVIKARLFEEGRYVRAGQPLYQIDPATYRASLDSANAGLAQAQAAYASAKLKADRYKELVAINAVSRQDNDDAQAAAQQAAANVQAQRAAVQQARINLDYTRVVAPISGRIGKSSVTAGRPGHRQPGRAAGHRPEPRQGLCRRHPVGRRPAEAAARPGRGPDRRADVGPGAA